MLQYQTQGRTSSGCKYLCTLLQQTGWAAERAIRCRVTQRVAVLTNRNDQQEVALTVTLVYPAVMPAFICTPAARNVRPMSYRAA